MKTMNSNMNVTFNNTKMCMVCVVVMVSEKIGSKFKILDM